MTISWFQAALLGLFACLSSMPGLGGTTIGNYTLGRPLVGGLVCGLIVAVLVYQLYLRAIPRFVVLSFYNKRTLKLSISRSFNKRTINILSFTILIMISTLLVASKVALKLLH